jgi:alpha,alpha-trehalose-phosphate synthase [UDP-forming]/trehalose-phosphatase
VSYRELKKFIEDNPALGNLIIVSNREPYIHKKTGQHIKVEAPAGGLTASIDEVMRTIGGTWVAWGSGTADRETVDDKDHVYVPPKHPSYVLKRVWLEEEEINNFYHGYSNHVLWPLCHISLDRVYFRKKYWYDYIRSNEKFAKAVLEEVSPRSVVWIHDYHLCIVPKILREKYPELAISHFWHIPWPNYSVFRICPQSKEILESLLKNNIIGFQLPLFSRNFMECVKESIEQADVDFKNSTITHKGHTTRVKDFPISVDFDKFNELAQSLKTINTMQLFKQRYHLTKKYIGIGVDRLEYTKGLIKRLQAIDLFFERYPKFIERFTFIQIAVPTRMKEPYVSYKASVEGLVRKINRKYARGNWNPIIYRDIKAEHKDLVVFYRLADVAVISSIYDGMNLVAKEFVASRIDRKGVLLLSEFAGAAEELEGAILVNPYDIEEFSDGIKTVLELPARDKASRMKTLRRQVKDKDIYNWICDILKDMVLHYSSRVQVCRYLFEHLEEFPENNILLFLDYDGTLTPIVDSPDKAVLSKKMRSLIAKLSESIPIAIISGRSIHDIIKLVDLDKLIYAGNHGAEIWESGELIVGQQLSDRKKTLKKIIKELKMSLSFLKGIVIEDKGITASIHYRMVAKRDQGTAFNIFWEIAGRYEDRFLIRSGKKVFEIRPRGVWNKGDAVKWIWERFGRDKIPVYIGDDTTDEDAFNAIKGRGIGISVGKNPVADFYMKNQREVRRLLKLLGSSL